MLNLGLMLYSGTICSLTEKTLFLYRYLLQIVPSIEHLTRFNQIFSVNFGVKALKVSGTGHSVLVYLIITFCLSLENA